MGKHFQRRDHENRLEFQARCRTEQAALVAKGLMKPRPGLPTPPPAPVAAKPKRIRKPAAKKEVVAAPKPKRVRKPAETVAA